MAKQKSRSTRWMEAANAAEAALQNLLDVQQEYQEWRDNLPENLDSSPIAEKLDAVIDLDIQGALDMVQEANGLDMPMGFGRD